MTPEAKLADRRWRYTNSWWVFVPVLSCGLLGWLGFMVAGIRTQQRKYWIACGIYSLCLLAFFTLIAIFGEEGTASDLALVPFLGCWIAPTVHAAIVNRGYLRTLAAQGAWYNTPSQQHAQSAPGDQRQTGPRTQPFLGINNNDYYGTGSQSQPFPQAQPPAAPYQHRTQGNPHAHYRGTPAPSPQPNPPAAPATPPRQAEPARPATVDIAQATNDQLTSLPGINHALASRIIAIRDARGGYRDLDDLASAANLQPHELIRLREHLVFPAQPTQQPHTGQRGSGRILDI